MPGSPPEPLPGETLAAMVVRLLGRRIVSGGLPPGARIEETAVAADYALSRTPVREALRSLAAIGLVETRPRRGTFVALITPRQIVERFELMAELEALCARYAARRMTAADRELLRQGHLAAAHLVVTDDRDAYRWHNLDFHALIYRGAGNQALAETTMAVRDSVAAFRAAQFDLTQRLSASQAEHDRVVTAILAGDAEAAGRSMHDHLRTVTDAVEHYLANLPPIPL